MSRHGGGGRLPSSARRAAQAAVPAWAQKGDVPVEATRGKGLEGFGGPNRL